MVSSLIIADTSRIIATASKIPHRGSSILFRFSAFQIYLVLIGSQNGIKMMITGLSYSAGNGNKYFKICDDYHGLVSKAAVLLFKQSYNKRMSYLHNWVGVFTKNKMRLVPTTACLQTSNSTSENPGCSSKIKAMQFQQDYGFGLSEYTLLYSHNECKS